MLRMEFFDPKTQSLDDESYELNPTKEELFIAKQIVGQMGYALLQANPGDKFETYYLHCFHDRIEWHGQDRADLKLPLAPIALMDFEELGQGVLPAVSPKQLQSLLFGGPESKLVIAELCIAVLWERDRVENGAKFNVHLPRTIEHLQMAVGHVRD